MPAQSQKRSCIRCGKPDTKAKFRSAGALKCLKCDAEYEAERKEYTRAYHRARARAVSRLIETYREDFDEFMEEERADA